MKILLAGAASLSLVIALVLTTGMGPTDDIQNPGADNPGPQAAPGETSHEQNTGYRDSNAGSQEFTGQPEQMGEPGPTVQPDAGTGALPGAGEAPGAGTEPAYEPGRFGQTPAEPGSMNGDMGNEQAPNTGGEPGIDPNPGAGPNTFEEEPGTPTPGWSNSGPGPDTGAVPGDQPGVDGPAGPEDFGIEGLSQDRGGLDHMDDFVPEAGEPSGLWEDRDWGPGRDNQLWDEEDDWGPGSGGGPGQTYMEQQRDAIDGFMEP